MLVDEFLPLQGGQLAQLHVQDRAAWISSISSSPIRDCCASEADALARISAMTSSIGRWP